MAGAKEGVRNVGILGHSGSGKTTLIEHMLHTSGATPRMGSIEQGNTVGDYLPEEIAHKHTLSMKFMHFDWHGMRVHVVDHPGYIDFVGEMAASLPLLDGAIILVDAATGIQAGTDKAMEYCDALTVPRAIFVNKLDRENTDFYRILAHIQETYGKYCVPLVVPVGNGDGIKDAMNIFDDDTSEIDDQIADIKEAMEDAVAEVDDELLETYLETGELSPEEFHKGLHEGIRKGKIVPVIAGSVDRNIGIKELMDVVADSFPTPAERKVVARNGQGDVELTVSPDEPFVGQVMRSIVDPYIGQLTVVRVLTGTLTGDGEITNVTQGGKERTGKLVLISGKEQQQIASAVPGDIVAMTKLKNTHFGDTLGANGLDATLSEIKLPPSLVKLAIFPKSRGDEDKIADALHRLEEEDPTFSHYRNEETGEHIIQGTGDLQLQFIIERLQNKYQVDVATAPPKVAYKESIRKTVEARAKHKKQSGGHGQYGDVHLRISPSPRGEGYAFIDSIVGGVIPKNFIPHVDKGCQERLDEGVLAGYPVVDVTVELFDGSFHNVDSSELAFKTAARKAIQKGIADAQPYLLEPIMEMDILVSDEYVGDVTADLNGKRGRVMSMEPAGGGRQRIKAQAPEAEILHYSAELRSITSGQGTYTLRLNHYEEVPGNITQSIIAEKKEPATV